MATGRADEVGEPSALVRDQLGALRAAGARGPIVDLACGRGRNARALAAAGLHCIGLDRDPGLLAALRAADPTRLDGVRCDLESGHEIPIRAGSCGAVLVFRFLFRPLCGAIERLLAPGGLLLYETFTRGQPDLGWGPRRPEFLLEPGELPRLFPGLEILHYDETPLEQPRPEASARLVARRP